MILVGQVLATVKVKRLDVGHRVAKEVLGAAIGSKVVEVTRILGGLRIMLEKQVRREARDQIRTLYLDIPRACSHCSNSSCCVSQLEA